MERKVYNRLLEWKEKDAGSCALLLDGARRVGKRHIIGSNSIPETRSLFLMRYRDIHRQGSLLNI